MFKTSYTDSVLPEGEYECRIVKAEQTKTKKDTPYLNIDMVIREDVEQPCARKHIWDSLFKNRETGQYSEKRMNQICQAAGIPEGVEISSIQDFCDTVILRCVRAVVKHKMDDYKGEKVSYVAYYKPSKFPVDNPEPGDNTSAVDDVDDEELPF